MGISLSSVLSDAGEFLFGGEDDSAQKDAMQQNQFSRDFIQEQLARSRGELLSGYPAAMDARNAGTQAAMNLFGASAPQRYGALSQGNLNAQQTLGAGLQQQHNAILGNPIDYSAFQPREVGYNTGWMQGLQTPRNPAAGGFASIFDDEPSNAEASAGNQDIAGSSAEVGPSTQSSINDLINAQSSQGQDFAPSPQSYAGGFRHPKTGQLVNLSSLLAGGRRF